MAMAKNAERNKITNASFSHSQQLFVGNLPHNCTEDDLNALFSKFGQVGLYGTIFGEFIQRNQVDM